MNIPLSPIQKLLCLALSCIPSHTKKRKALDTLTLINMTSLETDACIDEVAPHLHQLLTDIQYDSTPKLKEVYASTSERIHLLMNELESIATQLASQSIPIIALKNAGITKGIFKNPACSPMGDIDLLIEPKHFHQAHDLILQADYTFKFRSSHEKEDLKEAFLHGGTEYYKDINGIRVWLELQWRPIAGRWIQPENEPKSEELFKRSIPIEGSHVRLLSNEDNLLQVCLHTTKHSYVRAPGFRLHSDVDRIVSLTSIDWGIFMARASDLQVKTACYFALYLAYILLDTPIPKHALNSLKPSWLKKKLIWHFILQAGIFNQKKKKFNKVSYIVFNMLLYDTPSILFRGIFPTRETLQKQYPHTYAWQTPFMHAKRLLNLLFVRHTL